MSADDLKARLRNFGHIYAYEAADRIEALELALTQSRAETAAAYERAAVLADYFMQTCMDQETDPEVLTGYGRGMYFCAKQYQTEIRALATTEQTAALDAVRAEVLNAAAIYMNQQYGNRALSNPIDRQRILDAITKGDKA